MPCDYKDYSDNWEEISNARKEKVGWRCELCDAKHLEAHWKTGGKIILAVHHIDGDEANNSAANLLVCCQRCHLRLDREKHLKNRRKNLFKKKTKKGKL